MKRIICFVLAALMLAGSLAGCHAENNHQNETVATTTETTAPAEDFTHISPEDIFICHTLLDMEQMQVFDFGGSFITPVSISLSEEGRYEWCRLEKLILHLYYPCNEEDALQCGANFAYLLSKSRESENFDAICEIARDTFDILQGFYEMDELYTWVLVGLSCPEILPEYFSGNFSVAPDEEAINQVQEWIPHILEIQHSPALVTAIEQNPLFELEYLTNS